MKKVKIVLFIVIILSNSSLIATQSKIEVNTKSISPYKIPKLINGAFIELLIDFVNGKGGLWVQEIIDRGKMC
jgi:hypothetical protein